MRAIIFSWEYPPRVVGQLSGYVRALSTQLASSKVDVNVVTYDDCATGQTQEPSGVKTFRVANPVKTHIGVLTWVLTLNQEVERAAANIYYDTQKNRSNRRFRLAFYPSGSHIEKWAWHPICLLS